MAKRLLAPALWADWKPFGLGNTNTPPLHRDRQDR